MQDPDLRLRLAAVADVPHFDRWDRDPNVIRATSDDPDEEKAFGDTDWAEEIALNSAFFATYVAEVREANGAWRPFGAVQIMDPEKETSHYWGDCGPGLRAIDIWIGEPDLLGRGLGSRMMKWAIDRCFSAPEVEAIVIDPLASNHAAHRFYQRLGFRAVEERYFDEDFTLVHRLDRSDWSGPIHEESDT
ncbi:GNAT family N-acetyltransferase [bacterium]|nr:GNAT family N-acetyltransferase [bacterium]